MAKKRGPKRPKGNQTLRAGGAYGNKADLDQAHSTLEQLSQTDRMIPARRQRPKTKGELGTVTDEPRAPLPPLDRRQATPPPSPELIGRGTWPHREISDEEAARLVSLPATDAMADTTLIARLEKAAPGLAAQLADGLTQEDLNARSEELARALLDAGVPPGRYSFNHGDPGYGTIVSVPETRPGSVTSRTSARGGALPATDVRSSALPAGFRKGAPGGSQSVMPPESMAQLDRLEQFRELMPPGSHGPRAVIQLGAAKVLALHADLQYRMTRLSETMESYFSSFMEHGLAEADRRGGREAVAGRYAGMFYPARDGRELGGLMARMLSRGRTYQITRDMVDKADEEYEAAGRDWYTIPREVLPWAAGFAWLDKPAQFTDAYGRTTYNRAVSWDVTTAPARLADGGTVNTPHIRLVWWSWHEDIDDYATPDVREVMKTEGGLSMAFIRLIPAGGRVKAGDGVSGVEPQGDSIRWAYILWRLLSSEIAITNLRRPDFSRTDRRRIQRSLQHDQVHVVILRRPVREEPEEHGHREIGWQCRWPVQAFYRHVRKEPGFGAHHAVPDETREHCITCNARISHIAAYIKGPAGLPLKQEQQLYRLVR